MENQKSFFEMRRELMPILDAIKSSGGTAYLVGGSVRDLVLDRQLKDFDIEVHGLTLEGLENILKKFGPVSLVGKQFGVLKLHHVDADWSLPRRDSIGRKPAVVIEPTMTIAQACRRRDLTMNAMAINLHEKEIQVIDPYGGLEDIKQKRLRAVDPKLFIEDPLRFYRVMQFIGRFEMMPDQGLDDICRTMELHDIQTKQPLARERIFEEIKKLFLKSRSPSLGFRWLVSIDRLKDTFPELHELLNIQQRVDYHPEGTVFEHSMQTLDAAAQFDDYQTTLWGTAEEEKFMIMLGTLCHDLGKTTHTDDQLSCKGHDEAGVPLAKSLLKRLTNNMFISTAVTKLVRYHRAPITFLKDGSSAKAYKRLAAKLAPEVTLRQLGIVALADLQGRNSAGHEPLTLLHRDVFERFLHEAEKAQVAHQPEPPVLLGRHLLGLVAPGPEMGKILKKAYDLQIEEGIQDVEELKRRVLS
jgi:tRNA nucleotidyltransferase (CCA-adding enzyme)